ncbi:MAG: AAA family ATPase [Prevotellaceae bacterium]|nr:AAA family ATPase [Prevotellaceae bacterium]
MDNYYFVDKSKYITLVEKSLPNLLLIRPRRFGKSLFVGMLGAYYDILQKPRFDELFGMENSVDCRFVHRNPRKST